MKSQFIDEAKEAVVQAIDTLPEDSPLRQFNSNKARIEIAATTYDGGD